MNRALAALNMTPVPLPIFPFANQQVASFIIVCCYTMTLGEMRNKADIAHSMACEKGEMVQEQGEPVPRSSYVGRPLRSLTTRFCFCALVILLLRVIFMKCLSTSTLVALAIDRAVSQECQITTVRSEIPSDGLEVALRDYSYCGGQLALTVSE